MKNKYLFRIISVLSILSAEWTVLNYVDKKPLLLIKNFNLF